MAQLQQQQIDFSLFSAVDGAALSDAELTAAYDGEKAWRTFNRTLARGEIGCALSHIGIYEQMVALDLPHALILEDDASLFDATLPALLSKLEQLYASHLPVAVMLSHVPRYIGNRGIQLDQQHHLHDVYRGACTHGYFLTRAAAEILRKNLYPVYAVADKWEYFQQHLIAVKALIPYAVGLAPASLSSRIETMEKRNQKKNPNKNMSYYIRKHLHKFLFLLGTRPFIRIHRQEKSRYDLS